MFPCLVCLPGETARKLLNAGTDPILTWIGWLYSRSYIATPDGWLANVDETPLFYFRISNMISQPNIDR